MALPTPVALKDLEAILSSFDDRLAALESPVVPVDALPDAVVSDQATAE